MTLLDDTRAATGFTLVEDDRDNHKFRVHRSTMTSPEIFARSEEVV